MIDLLLDAMSAYRLTRLVTNDVITRPLRVRVIRHAYLTTPGWMAGDLEQTEAEWDSMPHEDDNAPKLAALIVCPWCISAYTSIIVVCMRRRFPRAWSPIATALALSSVTGLLAQLDG